MVGHQPHVYTAFVVWDCIASHVIFKQVPRDSQQVILAVELTAPCDKEAHLLLCAGPPHGIGDAGHRQTATLIRLSDLELSCFVILRRQMAERAGIVFAALTIEKEWKARQRITPIALLWGADWRCIATTV